MDEKRLVDGTTALAEKQARVIKIEPTERPQNVRLRVAAYTRVSSDSEDQLNSFAAQNRYYTELISSKAEWRMVDIYAAEVITRTSVTKPDDGRLPSGSDRSDPCQIYLPLCPQHQGLPSKYP